MPLGFGSSATFTTADPTASRPYTRLRGPLLIGAVSDLTAAGAGASITPPHIANVSTMRADFYGVHAGLNFPTSASTTVNGLIYMSQSSYTMTSSGGTSSGPPPTPSILGGAAIMFDPIAIKLCVFSTVIGEWRAVALSSS